MDDAAATRACLAGETEAFRHFVASYQARALAHARLLTRNDADAAEATQEAFVDAFRGLATYDPTRAFYPWFYVLLRNRCLKQTTRRATRAESGLVPEAAASDPAVSERHVDLWAAVQQDIHRSDRASLMPQLWPIAALLVARRALQLFVDLPLPVLHALVPLAATAVVVWQVGSDLLRIETLAPELQKRGL